MGKKAEASNNTCETWSRLLTEQPAPANCPCFCLDNLQEKTTVQNHHEAKVQRCESPLTWKEDGNVTSTGYKEKEITSPRDVTHYELTELYELISSPAEQRSVSALLSCKISTGTEPVPWDKWLWAGCSAAALGKEWIPQHWLSDITTHKPVVKLKITHHMEDLCCSFLQDREKAMSEKPPALLFQERYFQTQGNIFLPVTQKVTKWTSSGWRSNAPVMTRTAKMSVRGGRALLSGGEGHTPKPLPQPGQHCKLPSVHLLQNNRDLQRGAICNSKTLLRKCSATYSFWHWFSSGITSALLQSAIHLAAYI